jgi:hypothetical protein
MTQTFPSGARLWRVYFSHDGAMCSRLVRAARPTDAAEAVKSEGYVGQEIRVVNRIVAA